ncbi:hypothetical protein LC065_06055 [Halobacillus litoralis]|uniref:hypothetical protein n=1 Tax=Halobacillus litoralis TaxID=45668 RepID=UPI00273CF881|nr:hypothetical protein [Halobacillus litoralis]WLR48743.1 hypothetical protein LC065_06055 [Halobacillus litoralis]
MAFMNQSVIIGKSVEEVFSMATDFNNSPKIMDTVIDVQLLSEGPVKEGYRFPRKLEKSEGEKLVLSLRSPTLIPIVNTLSAVISMDWIYGIIMSSYKLRKEQG